MFYGIIAFIFFISHLVSQTSGSHVASRMLIIICKMVIPIYSCICEKMLTGMVISLHLFIILHEHLNQTSSLSIWFYVMTFCIFHLNIHYLLYNKIFQFH